MGRKKNQPTREPVHEAVQARNPLKDRNLNKYKTLDELRRLCTFCGLGTTGTIPELKKDLQMFNSLDWGGKTKKVSVATLRSAQGPSSIFDQVEHTPEAIFDIFFNNDMWDLIVTETNRYKPNTVRKGRAKWRRICLTLCSPKCFLKTKLLLRPK